MGLNKGVVVLSLGLCLMASYVSTLDYRWAGNTLPFIRGKRYSCKISVRRTDRRLQKEVVEGEIERLKKSITDWESRNTYSNPTIIQYKAEFNEKRAYLKQKFEKWSVSYRDYDNTRKADWQLMETYVDIGNGYTPDFILEQLKEIDKIRKEIIKRTEHPDLSRKKDIKDYESDKRELEKYLKQLLEKHNDKEPFVGIMEKSLDSLESLREELNKNIMALITERKKILDRRNGEDHIAIVKMFVEGNRPFGDYRVEELQREKKRLKEMDTAFDEASRSAAIVQILTEGKRLLKECDIRIKELQDADEVDNKIIAYSHFTILGLSTSYNKQLEMCRNGLNAMFVDNLNKVNALLPTGSLDMCNWLEVREIRNGFNKWVNWLRYTFQLKRNPPKQQDFTHMLENAGETIYSMAGEKLIEDPGIEEDEETSSLEDAKDKERILGDLSNWLAENEYLKLISYDNLKDSSEERKDKITSLKTLRGKLIGVKNVPNVMVEELERKRIKYEEANDKDELIKDFVKTVWETGENLEKAQKNLEPLYHEKIIEPVRTIVEAQVLVYEEVIKNYKICTGTGKGEIIDQEIPAL